MHQHFIITRFNIRNRYFKKRKAKDPLRPKNLDHRFKIFEIMCLSSILSQVNQDFTWILIVDPELSEEYRSRLFQLISARPNTFLVDFSYDLHVQKLDWLKPWIKFETSYVTTTNLDDDDALFTGFTRYLANHLDCLKENHKIPPILFLGCKNTLQWDFYYSKKAPLGYQKPKNSANFIPSVGFSVCCKYPEINLSVRSFQHHLFDILACKTNIFPDDEMNARLVSKNSQLIKESVLLSSLEWDGVLGTDNFHVFQVENDQVIILNHFDNIQYHRILFNLENRIPVSAATSFQDFIIDLPLAEDYIKKFSISLLFLIRLVINHFLVFPERNDDEKMSRLMYRKFKALPNLILGYRNLR